jgi:hypothetical protein
MMFRSFLLLIFLWSMPVGLAKPAVQNLTDLFLAGYTLIPEPRFVELTGDSVVFSSDWVLETQSADSENITVETLLIDMEALNGVKIRLGQSSSKVIQLSVHPGTVETGKGPGIERQAYQLTIDRTRIQVVGNSAVGLFYGVQTLLQLVKRSPKGTLILPECTIRDWPTSELRFQHWDTKHHQDRLEVLKKYLDWSARFKFNMIGFELEDKFSYPSHPTIGAPGAFTPEQLQELVEYGLKRHIQIVPQIQSPAHMAYVLKHPEYAHLRSDGSNYQICLCDEESYQLIFDMYQDVIDATKGVGYFHVSTDEVYYAGICQKCESPYNPYNRSLAWVKFVQRAHKFLSERDRRMLVWLEYPVLPEHVSLLPSDIIDGVWGNSYMPPRIPSVARRQYLEAEEAHGIRQLAYAAIGSSHYMIFPRYFSEGARAGHLQTIAERINNVVSMVDPAGVYGAFWNDTGRHCEIYWLGKAVVAQYGWTPQTPSLEQTAAAFTKIYYGDSIEPNQILQIYSALQEQARFFQNSWDLVDSQIHKPRYGDSDSKRSIARKNRTLPPPPLPEGPGLRFEPVYVGRYSELAAEAQDMLDRAAGLKMELVASMMSADRNHYNLEVLLSLADLLRHHALMIVSLREIEEALTEGRKAARADSPEEAVNTLLQAFGRAREIIDDRKTTFETLRGIWEKGHYPKGRSVDGRDFVHILDDVKDHWADRRPDLGYLIAPEERIGLENWMTKMADIIRSYAGANNLDVESIEAELHPPSF